MLIAIIIYIAHHHAGTIINYLIRSPVNIFTWKCDVNGLLFFCKH